MNILFCLLIIFSFISIVSFNFVRNKSRGGNEYRVNKYLKLRFENGRTFIYVNDRRFRQCMYLLMNISTNKVETYDGIGSIDEAAERLDRSHEGHPTLIEPRTEFWGHCSNIQAWAENDYDTRLLHRNLAFPLLKKLVEAGDPKAKRVFKEEIAIRLSSRHPTVFSFLYQQGYLKYLDLNELESIFEEIEEAELPMITQTAKALNEIFQREESPSKRILNRNLFGLFRPFDMSHIPFIFSKLKKDIEKRYQAKMVNLIYEKYNSRIKFPKIQFINDNIEYFDSEKYTFVKYKKKIIGIVQDEEKVSLINKRIEKIEIMSGLEDFYEKIRELDLSNNLISDLKGIENFCNLKKLKINNNLIQNINLLCQFPELEEVYLRNNRIQNDINFNAFPKVKYLDLSKNQQLTEIPLSIANLRYLEKVKVWNCNIRKFNKNTADYFWNFQNYRYFKGFTQEDILYYERTHKSKAQSHVDNGLYKAFCKWLINMKKRMQKFNFSYEDIRDFEVSNPEINPIWSGRLTNAFRAWLDLRYQKKITDFL